MKLIDFTQGTAWEQGLWALGGDEAIDQSLPLITIAILNFNRATELVRTLDVVVNAVQYPHSQVIVVDNGSSDSSVELVRNRFPSVEVVEVGRNLGTSARNKAVDRAVGKYIFFYDDDSMPAGPATILRIVQFLELHSSVAAVNGICYQPLTNYTESLGMEKYYSGSVSQEGAEGVFLIEGGVCYRASALRQINGYDPRFFWGHEGFDVALQSYRAGHRILYSPWCATLHLRSEVNRVNSKNAKFRARNGLWLIAKHFPILLQPLLLAIFCFRRLLAALYRSDLRQANLEGLGRGLIGIGEFVKERPKMSFVQALRLKRFYLHLYRW